MDLQDYLIQCLEVKINLIFFDIHLQLQFQYCFYYFVFIYLNFNLTLYCRFYYYKLNFLNKLIKKINSYNLNLNESKFYENFIRLFVNKFH